ncbi:MAG TPA: hypothetical protein VKA03_03335 [Methylovirgula sp.]|nr:hypothetical protein [Methylovirgula sp.]
MIHVQPIRPLSFIEILDDLPLDCVAEQPAAAIASANRDWLFQLFSAIESSPDPTSGGKAYREAAVEAPPTAPMSEEERVAVELELDSAATAADLKRIRRAFALRNHPDLFHHGLCAQATSRMKIANMLIDRRRKEIAGGPK